MKKFFTFLVGCSLSFSAVAAEKIVNVYTWAGIIPDSIIQEFEKETGIKVNFSTYDSNEVMFAKLKASKTPGYDLVEPSSYYIDRMRRQDLLTKLDKTQLSYFKTLNPDLLNQDYDPKNNYSIPFNWGVTGIFINKTKFPENSVQQWKDFWKPEYKDELLLLDDPREVFAVALHVLGYSANETNPEHIKQAYLKLKELLPNVKIFSSAVLSLLIDEDVTLGMAWNGDVYKARKENPQLQFIYPKDGAVIWVDNFAIPKNAPHPENAYAFLNFIMRPEVAKRIALATNFPTANKEAQKLLPAEVRQNPVAYPSREIIKRGEFQKDVGEEALLVYEKYWELLKMGG